MPKFQDITGKRYGLLTILRQAPHRGDLIRWYYRCDCGKEGMTTGNSFRTRPNASCGCARIATLKRIKRTHGHTPVGTSSPTYNTWAGMWQRTSNPNSQSYKNYGARGISVCERWRSFENFLADMGEKPEGLTLERLDVDGNYCAENCIWVDRLAQGANKHNQSKWLVEGQTLTQAQAARYWGTTKDLARRRLQSVPLHSGRVPKWHNDYRPYGEP